MVVFSLALLMASKAFSVFATFCVISPLPISNYPEASSDQFVEESAVLLDVTENDDDSVRIILHGVADESPNGKRFYLITTSTRLPSDTMNFRSILNQRSNGSGSEKHIAESIKRLHPVNNDAGRSITLELSKQMAMRSYIVWDYKPDWIGFDGGVWLTYDIPAFIDYKYSSQN